MAKNSKYIIKFNAPYTFEGTEYKEIDLSGLEELNTNDLANADRIFIQKGLTDPIKEINVTYCIIIAAIASKKPLEFFEKLKAPDAIKIKTAVSGFLLL